MYDGDCDMLAAALLASEELRGRLAEELAHYKQIAIEASKSLSAAQELAKRRSLRIQKLQQEIADRVGAQYTAENTQTIYFGEDPSLRAELDRVTRLLVDKVSECNDWKRRYDELNARMVTVKTALQNLEQPAAVPPEAAAAKSSPAEPVVKGTPNLVVINSTPRSDGTSGQ
jgi:chromosome segregation ATPase